VRGTGRSGFIPVSFTNNPRLAARFRAGQRRELQVRGWRREAPSFEATDDHLRRRLFDVAYAMKYTAPFRDDAECVEWLAYPSPPDRARRLALFARAYGLASTNGLVDEVIRVQEEQIRAVEEFAAAGRYPQTEWVANGHLDVLGARAAWTQANRHLFETRGSGTADP
jgi:hypothetical protein